MLLTATSQLASGPSWISSSLLPGRSGLSAFSSSSSETYEAWESSSSLASESSRFEMAAVAEGRPGRVEVPPVVVLMAILCSGEGRSEVDKLKEEAEDEEEREARSGSFAELFSLRTLGRTGQVQQGLTGSTHRNNKLQPRERKKNVHSPPASFSLIPSVRRDCRSEPTRRVIKQTRLRREVDEERVQGVGRLEGAMGGRRKVVSLDAWVDWSSPASRRRDERRRASKVGHSGPKKEGGRRKLTQSQRWLPWPSCRCEERARQSWQGKSGASGSVRGKRIVSETSRFELDLLRAERT